MATANDAHLIRWRAAVTAAKAKTIPYIEGSAIAKFWRANEWVGSPLGPEMPLDDGGTVQPFTGAVLKWTGGDSVEVQH